MVFLFVGSGFERKGVPLLHRLWPHLPAHAHLVVVGRDRHLGRYRDVAAPRIHFAGPQTDMAPWYGLADAFVLPTLYDPFPNAALEAAASGLPVLTSTKCGAIEMLTAGVSGDARDALDEAGWLALLRAWSDPERCAAARPAARAAAEPYHLAAMEGRYRELYAQVLGEVAGP
jgi:UDP-glucose:(heptosyl)LPS alpha-1,3-glucosyltransferase